MLSYNGCIDKVSPQYDSSYVYQDYSSVKMPCHTGCMEMVSPHVPTYVYQYHSSVKILSYKGCIDVVSPQYESSYAGQEYPSMKMFFYTLFIEMASPHYESAMQALIIKVSPQYEYIYGYQDH